MALEVQKVLKKKQLVWWSLLVLAIAALLAVPVTQVFAQSSSTGPKRQSGVAVAKPKKPASAGEETPKSVTEDPIESKYKKEPGIDIENPKDVPTFRSDVFTVELDVAVLTNNGQFIPGVPAGNFQILEDKVPQQTATFEVGEAPMTVAIIIEFSNLYQQFWSETWYQTLTAAYGFVESLKPEDYVAIVAYDLRSEILTDFTQNRKEINDALRRLQIAAYSESNLFDAVTDVAKRMEDIEGRKAIVLISSGIDTFSKLNYGETRKILQSAGVPIYAIGLMQYVREYYDARGALGPISRLDFLQADNQMRTFARETGGVAFFPRFYGEFPNIFQGINHALRNRYFMTYNPTNQARDGKERDIEVRLIDPKTGKPLRITDQKGKNVKYQILHKEGYTAPREVE